MNSLVELHDDELWVYVQRNAKMVTISREGYTTLSRYDLQTTIEEGRTYTMLLSSQGPVVRMQMVLFQISPASSKAVVMLKGTLPDATEELLGTADDNGQLAKNMLLGTYTYRVIGENYHPSEGRFTLSNQQETHQEHVVLRPRFSTITLQVADGSNADIYVNGERKGSRSWQGPLNAGIYQVECRQVNHRSTMQSITVEENHPETYALQPPTPITGILSVISQPLGATIKIDGRDYGTTPRNISDLLVGNHAITLSIEGYVDKQATVEVKEGESTDLNLMLERATVLTPIAQNNNPSTSNVKSFTIKGNGKTITFNMILVESGTFQMGDSNMGPVHSVTLTKAYYMGETEVTQGLWYAVMGQSPTSSGSSWSSGYGLGDKYPAYDISYKDCQKFLTKLNQMTGQKFRFPTEAEWEFAARGGVKSKGYTYAGSNTVDDVAWYNANSGKTHEVGTKKANELGLYDMSGNVWEWCADRYGSYSSSAQSNPTGPTTGSYRVFRGGSWDYFATNCRVAYRNRRTPSYRDRDLGFRLAL